MSFIGNIFILDDVLKNRGCNKLNYPNVTEINDVCYDTSNKEICVADLLYDKDKARNGRYPVMVVIHGGGWIVGDKKYRRGYSLQLADEGLFIMNINYGLAPDYKYPYSIQNCFAALQWLIDNAEKYKLDLDNLFLSGDSAGGHMAAVVAAALTNPDYRKQLECPDIKIKIKGTLLYCGMYDFDDKLLKLPVADYMVKSYTGVKPRKIKTFKYYDYLNPISHITGDFPPSFVVSGKQDIMTNKNHEYIMEQFDKVEVPYIHYRGTQFFNCFHCFHLKVWMREAKNCLTASRHFVTTLIESDAMDSNVENYGIAK